ncbi:MAG: hypothetical protein IT237_01980 [Bacteroidia bacterium]|nr:hypothetical protein [Bacteroidia bacterium]
MFSKHLKHILFTSIFLLGIVGVHTSFALTSHETTLRFEKLVSQNKIVLAGEHQLDDVLYILPAQTGSAVFTQLRLIDEFQISDKLLPDLHVLEILFTSTNNVHKNYQRIQQQPTISHLSSGKYLYIRTFRI